MILFKIRWFWILFFMVLVSVLLPGLIGWHQLDSGVVNAADTAAVKFLSERLFFISLISAIVISVIAVLMLISSRHNTRKAENLLLSKRWMQDGGDSAVWEESFGDLGTGFYRVNQELLETNRRRGTKIRGMNSLVAFLIKNFDTPVFVVNAAGDVVYVSNEYVEKSETNRSVMLHQPLNQILSDVYFPEIVSEFAKNPGMQELVSGKRSYKLYNISDHRGETAYVLFSLGKKTFYQAVVDDEPAEKISKKRRWFW